MMVAYTLAALCALLAAWPMFAERAQMGDVMVLLQRAVIKDSVLSEEEPTTSRQGANETTWSCVGEGLKRTCRFKNLYFGRRADGSGNADFYIFTSSNEQKEEINVYRSSKYDWAWTPHVQLFDSAAEMEKHLATRRVLDQKGLSMHFNPLFHHNIGHALFDGLYPAYVALTKLGLQETPFRPVIGVEEGCYDDNEIAPMEPGHVVEAYLPDGGEETGHTLRPQLAEIVEMPALTHEARCDFQEDTDGAGPDMGSRLMSGADGHRDACCKACAQSFHCASAVLYDGVCYLKGACPEGTTCGIAQQHRLMCTLKAGGFQGNFTVKPLDSDGKGLNMHHTVPEAWVLNRVRRRCMSEGIYQTFGSAGEMLRLFEMDRDSAASPKLLFRFEDVVIGVGGAGNMVQDPTGAIGGTVVPEGTMTSFRDRMYRSYGLEEEKAAFLQRGADQNKKLDVIIVSNKRYSAEDVSLLHNVMQDVNSVTVNCEYIDWHQLGHPEHRFKDHLRRMLKVDVYVSSPGTALQYVPFLRDKRVYVALGMVWKHEGRVFPTFMEQQLAGGGTPYVKTLYADPGVALRQDVSLINTTGQGDLMLAAVNGSQVKNLLNQAVGLIESGFEIPVPIKDNISPEGRVLLELCQQDSESCQEMTQERNVGPTFECEAWLWGEAIVYEVGPWAQQGPCSVNHQLIRTLRKQHKLFGYGAPAV